MPKNRNRQEDQLVKAIQQKRRFDELMPKIEKLLQAGGTAEAVLKKSESLAAVTLVELLNSDKDEVRAKVAKDIMERVSGKAVERSVSVNIGHLAEQDIDAQIERLINEVKGKGNDEFAVLTQANQRRKQKRKPRKQADLLIDVTPDGSQKPSA